ncbi:eIF-2-alpha kinase GCN2-like [Hylaeus volcanicus]|uniref:eIF-2-alpha kinase GCN2-like n=1 Tax=Hylaeus volcanicus TaxID=313075 RepID=UPI0023B78004|nr:eIF-2-alpha kinase GCN2-like [Hylaeus volcanicus]
MFSLLNGVIASGDKIDPTVITQPDLQDFLLKCLTNDKRKRWSAEQLLQHTFIKAPLVRALSPPKVPRRDEQKNHEPEETDTDIRQYLPPLGGHSRITNEFEVLEWLGKGASGDVLKVKNKLDGRIYAIKRIELNPKNEQQDWKIIREVKSLSCMTHKNVVRYYNSWIENATDDMENLPDSGEDNSDVSMVTDNVKDIACGTVASNSIEFVKDSKCQETVSSVKEDETGDTYSSKATVREIQFMYIQMEFCEKSTLRTAIDAGLYKNQKRVWRLFEEIVEGLAHIHRRGIIHRDLKPVNIFLDSNDHVKIGDFGLARNILSSFVPTMATDKEPQVSKKGISFSTEDIGSLTEQVGTALYVAPELMTKAPYDQKVDIYSLGIILFEMCYKPPATGMERIKVLHNLRLKEIIIPTEMLQADMPLQIHILRRLLNHDPNQRPKAQEIRSLRAKALSFGQMVGKNYFKKTKGK